MFPLKPFDKQLEVLRHKARRKMVVTSRRSGKSSMCIWYLVYMAIMYPGSTIAYVGKTQKNLKKVVFQPLKQLLAPLKPYIDIHFKEAEQSIRIGTSEILLFAADNDGTADSMRGLKLKLAVIDECASLSSLAYLVDEVVWPCLCDLLGTLLLIGTPSPPVGFFYESWSAPDTSFVCFKWLIDDNPHMSLAAIEAFKAPYNVNSAAYRREVLAEFAASADSVFTLEEKNKQDEAPDVDPAMWQYVVSIDPGSRDPCGLLVGMWSQYSDDIWIIKSMKLRESNIDLIAANIKMLVDSYVPKQSRTFVHYIYDAAALWCARELQQRYSLPFCPAIKKDKAGAIAKVNTCLYNGRLKIVTDDNYELLQEMQALTWKQGQSAEEWKGGVEDHIVDAMIYFMNSLGAEASRPIAPGRDFALDPEEEKFVNKWIEQQEESESFFGAFTDEEDPWQYS